MAFSRRTFVGMSATAAGIALGGFARAGGKADLILRSGRIHVVEPRGVFAEAVAVVGGRILAVGTNADVDGLRGPATQVVDLRGRTVVPGLNDSHMHFVRGSLSYDLDVRWDGIRSIPEALARLARQAARTPPGQWVRVGGGWSEFQFAERRMPTLAELNAAVPDRPAYVLYFYDRAMVNRAGLAALGMDASSKDPPGGVIERDATGTPTGMLTAHPLPAVVLAPENAMPALSAAAAEASVARFARELNRLGLTSVIDPGGAGQAYPDMYGAVTAVARRGGLGVRLGMFIIPQVPGREIDDYRRWGASLPALGDEHRFRFVGGGEVLMQGMQDWDLYTTPPVAISDAMVEPVSRSLRMLFDQGWYAREHATFDHSVSVYVDAVERALAAAPRGRSRWIVDHAELVGDDNLRRIARLGGGIAVQHRAAFHGELGARIHGEAALTTAPPIRRMLELGIPVGVGTDATRDTTYNPWVAVQWLVTGRTVGGTPLRAGSELLDVATAIRLYTLGSAWFSGEESVKGALTPGRLADLAVLSQPIFDVPPPELDRTCSVLTVMDGAVVHAAAEHSHLAPPPLPAPAAWSPNA